MSQHKQAKAKAKAKDRNRARTRAKKKARARALAKKKTRAKARARARARGRDREYKIFRRKTDNWPCVEYVDFKGSQWLPCDDIFWSVMGYAAVIPHEFGVYLEQVDDLGNIMPRKFYLEGFKLEILDKPMTQMEKVIEMTRCSSTQRAKVKAKARVRAREYKVFSRVINGKIVNVNCKGSQWLPCDDIFWLVMGYLNFEDSLKMLSVNRYSWRILRQDVDFILYKIDSETTVKMLTDWEFFKKIRYSKSIDFKSIKVTLRDLKSMDFEFHEFEHDRCDQFGKTYAKYLSDTLINSALRYISRLNGVHTVEIIDCYWIYDISPLGNCKIVTVRNPDWEPPLFNFHIGDMRNICYLRIDLFAAKFKPRDQDFLPYNNHVEVIQRNRWSGGPIYVDFKHLFFKDVKSLTINGFCDIDISQLKCERIYFVDCRNIRFCNENQNLRFVAEDIDTDENGGVVPRDFKSKDGKSCAVVNSGCFNELEEPIIDVMDSKIDIKEFIDELGIDILPLPPSNERSWHFKIV